MVPKLRVHHEKARALVEASCAGVAALRHHASAGTAPVAQPAQGRPDECLAILLTSSPLGNGYQSEFAEAVWAKVAAGIPSCTLRVVEYPDNVSRAETAIANPGSVQLHRTFAGKPGVVEEARVPVGLRSDALQRSDVGGRCRPHGPAFEP